MSVRFAVAYSFNVYDKFQLKLSSWRAGISVKLLLRLQLLLLRQTAPDQANGYSILVRGNVIPGRSFITISIVVVTLVLALRNKEKYENRRKIPWMTTPWLGPGFTRLSPRKTVFSIRSHTRIPFSLIFCFHYTHFATFSFFFSSQRVLSDDTHSLQQRLFQTIPFPVTKFTYKTYFETLLKIAFFSMYKY